MLDDFFCMFVVVVFFTSTYRSLYIDFVCVFLFISFYSILSLRTFLLLVCYNSLTAWRYDSSSEFVCLSLSHTINCLDVLLCVCVCVLVFYKTPNITRDLLCGAFLFFLLSLRFNYVYLLLLLFMRIELNLIPFAFYVLFARRRYFVFFLVFSNIFLCAVLRKRVKSLLFVYIIFFFIYIDILYYSFVRCCVSCFFWLVGWWNCCVYVQDMVEC